MKALKDFENELNKCSKCGLCEPACPLFKITPNDCVASKGKFIMLHGVTKGDLKLSKNINKYLDMCLRCGKCNHLCPSNIDIRQILNAAKYEYMKNSFWGHFIFLLESKYIFNNIIRLISNLTNCFRPKFKQFSNNTTTVLYFKGCVNQMFPNTDRYLYKIFKNAPINIITEDFDCCGLPLLSDGNMERFINAAEYNTKLINKNKYDYLITDCASCQHTINEYPKYINETVVPAEKSINWGDLIAAKNIHFKFNKPIKVTFHKPCHLDNDNFLHHILKNCENVEYIEMNNYDDCCGFAGSFSIKNFKTFNKIAKEKANNIINTKAEYVITTCPGCILGLKHGLNLTHKNIKVLSLLEFLAKADEITY